MFNFMKTKRILFLITIITLISSLNIRQVRALDKEAKVENFVLYSVQGKRCIFYDIVKALPAKGLLILNFTSVYCKPCKKEIPELLEISEKAGNWASLVCIYAEAGDPVKKSAGELGILSKTYVDPFGKIRKSFNVKKIPVTFVIKKNIIKGRFVGYTKENIKAIKELVLP